MGRASLWLKTPQPGKSAAASTIAAIAFYFMACFGNAQLENFFPIKANKAMSAKAWLARFLLTRRACIVKAAGQSAGARRQ